VRTENILKKKLFKNNGVTIIIASGANFETLKSFRTRTVNRDQQGTLKNTHTYRVEEGTQFPVLWSGLVSWVSALHRVNLIAPFLLKQNCPRRISFHGGSVGEWSACRTGSQAVPGSSPALTTSWIRFPVAQSSNPRPLVCSI